MRNLIDNKTGLSYEIIDQCDDREQLLQWQLECLESLREIKSDLKGYELSHDADEEKSVWYIKAKMMKNIKSRMALFINFRLSKVNKIIKQQNIEKSKQEHSIYLNGAANFHQIVEQTYNEKVKMYMKKTKPELISMLIECNRLLDMYAKPHVK